MNPEGLGGVIRVKERRGSKAQPESRRSRKASQFYRFKIYML